MTNETVAHNRYHFFKMKNKTFQNEIIFIQYFVAYFVVTLASDSAKNEEQKKIHLNEKQQIFDTFQQHLFKL